MNVNLMPGADCRQGGWALRGLGISTQGLHKLFYFLKFTTYLLKNRGKESYDIPILAV
jgi:hypothetical protein